MKYLLTIYAAQGTAGHEAALPETAAQDAFSAAFFETGELIGAFGLADPVHAGTVRVRAGVIDVSEGPYLAGEEQPAGYYLLDCQDRARALEIAALMPFASFDAVEVRPVMHEAAPQL
jgi:hypothetical protein